MANMRVKCRQRQHSRRVGLPGQGIQLSCIVFRQSTQGMTLAPELHEAGVEPDWAIRTSIDAINASIIAGNRPTELMSRLKAFWQSVKRGPFQQVSEQCRCGGVGIEVAHFDGRHGDAPAPCQHPAPLPTREKFCSVRSNTSETGWIEIAPTS